MSGRGAKAQAGGQVWLDFGSRINTYSSTGPQEAAAPAAVRGALPSSQNSALMLRKRR